MRNTTNSVCLPAATMTPSEVSLPTILAGEHVRCSGLRSKHTRVANLVCSPHDTIPHTQKGFAKQVQPTTMKRPGRARNSRKDVQEGRGTKKNKFYVPWYDFIHSRTHSGACVTLTSRSMRTYCMKTVCVCRLYFCCMHRSDKDNGTHRLLFLQTRNDDTTKT